MGYNRIKDHPDFTEIRMLDCGFVLSEISKVIFVFSRVLGDVI